MHHPYQCLQAFSSGESQFLLASGGPKLFSVNLEDGSIVSTWLNQEPKAKVESTESTSEGVESPSKKRKLSTVEHEDPPNIISLVVTSDHRYAVVVTGEDKCVRVFEITDDGQIKQLSQRIMPKRPCAVVLSPNETHIISGDKFGDVYSIPLLPTAEEDEAAIASSKPETPKIYAPVATETTVHSQANRRTLEAQQKQAQEKKPPSKTKEPLQFAHELILGHVSLLTDVLVATIEDEEGDASPKTYVLTSDRDEHIRVSRGPPQSFVIEGYCLGHQAFINKMCFAKPSLLVSGGGDDELYVWNWLEHTLLKKIDLLEAVLRVRKILKQEEGEEESELESRIAVRGLWTCPGPTLGKAELLVACEGVPALFHIPVTSLLDSKTHVIGFIPLAGNPLDVTILAGGIIISIDTIHEPGSTINVDSNEEVKSRLQAFDLIGADLDGGGVWKANDHLNHSLVDLNEQSTVDWQEDKLRALLYSVENLRKRDTGGEE